MICPNCNGKGSICNDMWICDVCEGRKVIDNEETHERLRKNNSIELKRAWKEFLKEQKSKNAKRGK